MQTTLAIDEAERDRPPCCVAGSRGSPARASDDICYATTNRQQAVRAVAAEVDLVLVVGSQNSSNSHRLAEVAERGGCRAYLVDDADHVDLAWLAGVRRVGITAGASAPPRPRGRIGRLPVAASAPSATREISVVDEDVRFTLPREVS